MLQLKHIFDNQKKQLDTKKHGYKGSAA
jgi:hypothetical protein